MLQDLKQAARTLRRQPAFTLLAIGVLGLGIGASTALFSVVSAVLLRPLPYFEPDRLVLVSEHVVHLGSSRTVSPSNFVDWQRRNHVFAGLDCYTENFLNLTGDEGPPERLYGVGASAGFFETLGMRAAHGRLFRPDDAERTEPRPVVLSHGLWQRRFGGDPGILGRTITLQTGRREVIGVLPADFVFLDKRFDVFETTSFTEEQIRNWRGRRWLTVVGRLKPGMTLARAQADMDVLTARLAEEYPETNKGCGARVRLLAHHLLGHARPALWILLLSVLLVLLIAAANVANLQLVRALARGRDLATRAALGATRARLVRSLLAESLLLAVGGAAIGIAVAGVSRRAILALAPADVPRIETIGLDARVVAFAFLAALTANLISGLLPALQASRRDLHQALNEGGRMGTGGHRRAQRAFAVAQVALSVALLAAAGLLIKSFLRMQNVETGFVTEEAVAMDLSLGRAHGDLDARARFFEQLIARVEARPGVRAAGVTTDLPLSGETSRRSFTIERPSPLEGEKLDAEIRRVSARFFEAMGQPLRRGRGLEPGLDGVVVNEAMARRFFPGGDALGRRLVIEDGPRRSREIVGVVADVKHFGLDRETPPEIYLSHLDRPWSNMTLVVRAAEGDPARLAGEVRRELAALDPSLPLANVKTIEQYVAASVAGPRFTMSLAASFAAAAVLLAALGVYGVIAGSVAQRTAELGVRMALGADGRDVRRLVVGEGLRLAAGGVLFGVAVALVLGRLVSRLLFEVSAADPLVLLAVVVVVSAAALLAAYLPARRASRLNPTIAMRSSIL